MTTQKRIDQFANRIAARLEGGGVPHDVSERLRIARQQALAARKTAALAAAQPASAIVTQGRHAALAAGGEPDFGWLGWLAPALALAALLAGLLALQPQQMRLPDPRVAEVDADLVADALPPKAYADPGFLQYLRLTQPPANVH
jgi:putative transmembrane protein